MGEFGEPVAGSGLEAHEIIVRFGGLTALDGVSLHAPPGRITGLIGPNGAGKTTMFNVCGGYARPDAGRVSFDGRDITREPPERRARLGIGRTFQRVQLWSSMTVRENLALGVEAAYVHDDPVTQLGLRRGGRAVRAQAQAEATELLDVLDLGSVADHIAGTLPAGQARLVELGRALARKPLLLMLDEPSAGLDTGEAKSFARLLRNLVSERQIGVLMVEHDMDLVLSLCDWIYVIDFGRPLLAGTQADVRSSETVRDAYLGTAVS